MTPSERRQLAAADKGLLEQVSAFHAELSRFIDLAQQRQLHNIPPNRCWWYLDVLAQLPASTLYLLERGNRFQALDRELAARRPADSPVDKAEVEADISDAIAAVRAARRKVSL